MTLVLLWFCLSRADTYLPTLRMGLHFAISSAGLHGNDSPESRQAILIYTSRELDLLLLNHSLTLELLACLWHTQSSLRVMIYGRKRGWLDLKLFD